MYLLAHRGAHAQLHENTLEAFLAAAKLGFDGIETDVRVSADQEAVLIHDRVAPNGIPVAALTRRELSDACGYPVPTLTEALDAIPSLLWNIEIKTPAAASIALPILQRYEARHRLLITSFHHDVALAAARALKSPCGFLNAHKPVAINTLLHAALPVANLRTLVWHYEVLDQEIVRQTNNLGFRNAVYGAGTPFEHDLCREFGVHALITDHPEHCGLSAAGAKHH
ncbi:glycerophosphodiester phosphodiesterase [Parachitinimonas caeni]|uniref:Glycerophosphodiester phosphodiesterase n=1 Tax=Parachitinimonas caeni TaxID=3031301 RepID=A0ABT7DW36_9NEIS|nr:glycerophosphodiester phosphodiesterase [Parachitinimonas caeni]MDK2124267.1 glycerophosphodiester phosphodiesterase [Parachitinimonas caeni]